MSVEAKLYTPRRSTADEGKLLEEAIAQLRSAGVEVWGTALTLERARRWLSVVRGPR